MHLFISYLWVNPRLFFAITLLVVFSVVCHEFMHAFTALKCGDSTAADAGHLTFNPLKQMGIFSLIMLAVMGIAWGQVPVNPVKMRRRFDPALVAAAGPLTNLVLAVFFTAVTYICIKTGVGDNFSAAVLFYAAKLNLVLMIFNLLPVPGLDGFAILAAIRPQLFRSGGTEVVRGAFFMLIALAFIFIDRLFTAAENIAAAALLLLQKIFG